MQAYNYTSWGYQDCQFGKDDGSYTGMLTKLLFRTLPDYYPADSAFAFFPFLVPPIAKDSLAKLPDSPVDKYNWSRPAAPKDLVIATSYQDVGTVLVDTKNFQSGSDSKIKKITNNVILYKRTVNHLFIYSSYSLSLMHSPQVQKLLFSDQNIRTWVHCFQYTSVLLIREKSIKHVGSALKYVDIVKDVINLLPVYWLADEIVRRQFGLIPFLTTSLSARSRDEDKKQPSWHLHRSASLRTVFQCREVSMSMLLTYVSISLAISYVYMNTDPGNDWRLREASHKTAKHFIERIKGHLLRLSGSIVSVHPIC
jgi:linoleate 10R-lipoxygenase